MTKCRWCDKEAKIADFCFRHYSRQYRHPLGEDEFWSRVTKTPECWNYSGPTRRGYGRVAIMDYGTGEVGRYWAAMWLYEKLNGSIGDMGLFLTCGNKVCVNPAHMTKIGRSARATFRRMW